MTLTAGLSEWTASEDSVATTNESQLDLGEAERKLMVLVLNEYSGSAQVAVELDPPLIGKQSYNEWGNDIFRSRRSGSERCEPLADLDWARALLLTDFGFGSDMVANARRFGPARDEYWVLVLRSLQEKLSNQRREELVIDNARFPTQHSAQNGRTPDVTNDTGDVELDDDERRLMTATLDAYARSPRRGWNYSPL